MLRKFISVVLIIFHLLFCSHISDAFAFQASSVSYMLLSARTTEGGGSKSGASYKILQDAAGESIVGSLASTTYRLNTGYTASLRTSKPLQTQIIPNQAWLENESKSAAFDLDDYFSSPDGLSLNYSVIGNSDISVVVDSVTHLVSFSQNPGWHGVETIQFTAIDTNNSSSTSNDIALQVEGVDNPPALDYIPDISAYENDLITITPLAADLDGDDITYSYSLPFNAQGQWQTDYDDSGLYTITVKATDTTGLFSTQQLRVNVGNVNRAPVLNMIDDITVNEGVQVVLNPSASDLDSDALTFYYTSPLDSTGRWLSDYSDAGTYPVTITVSDGTVSTSQNVNITIVNVNQAPEVSLSFDKYTVSPNESLSVTLSASDYDNDVMTFSIKKDGLEVESGAFDGNHVYTTFFSVIGDHQISAVVRDSHGAETALSHSIDVTDPNVNANVVCPVMGDYNGDSLMDLGIYNADTGFWEVCFSNKGVFTNSVDWLSGFGTSCVWSPIGGDFNGDAKSDAGIYNSTTGEVKIALSCGTHFIVSGAWLTFSGASSCWKVFSGNFNADRYSDLGFYNKDTGEIKAALGTGSGFQSPAVWLSNAGIDYTPVGGDFNGDSLTDVCLFKKSTGEFWVALSNTKAFVDGAVWLSGFAVDQDPSLSDFNHDGLTDVGFWQKATSQWSYAISTGDHFVNKGTWLDSFGEERHESAITADFNGDGIMDRALFDAQDIGINRWNVKLNTQLIPDLLMEIDNGTGGKIQVAYSYASSQENNALPFPVYVASSISAVDMLPLDQPLESYTQNFNYSGGYFDAVEREFRGFAKTTVTDPITGNYSETYFYQGRAGEEAALKSKIQKIVSYDGCGLQISQTVNSYSVIKSGPQDNVLAFPALYDTSTTVWEENGASLSTKEIMTFDSIGNPIQVRSEGNLAVAGDEKTVSTSYASAYEINPVFNSGLNRVLQTVLKDKDDTIISRKTFNYDTKGNLSDETLYNYNPLTSSYTSALTQYTYDDFGNLATSTDALDHTIVTEYESLYHTYPQTITNNLGHTVHYTYDAKFGCVLSVTDSNNQTSSSAYDSFGRLLYSTNALGEVQATHSYPDFNTKVTTNALGLFSKEYIDGLGRKYKVISSGEDGDISRQVSSEVYYNNRGAVEKESIAHYIDEPFENISYICYEYDVRGRISKTISDFPGTSKDAESSVHYVSPLYTETIDPLAHKKGTLKDVYGNITEVTEFTQGGVYKTTYQYDIQNNLIKLIDSQNNTTQIWYDSIGRKLKMDDPDMGIWTYEYDVLGNLVKQTDAKGQVLQFEYDALNRLTHKVAMSPSHQVTSETIYGYDDLEKDNCVGRLSKVTDLSGNTEFFYDVLGREIKSIKTVTTSPDTSHQYTVQREYDILDRLTNLTYPDGSVVQYSYDTNSGLLEKVQALGGATVYVDDIDYNSRGQINTIKYGNGTQTDYTYGQDLRLSRILTSSLVNPQTGTLQDLNYIFDKNGNISTLTDNLKSNIRTYLYDDLDRLTQASSLPSSQGGYTNYNYQYDSIGNMTYKSDVGIMSYGFNAGPHAVTFAGGYSYQYDANGNMTTGKNKTLEYDVENRIIKIIQADQTTNFTYDGDGGRVRKVATSPSHQVTSETTYIGSLFEIQTTDDSTATTEKTVKHIFAGSNKACSIEVATSPDTSHQYYYHTDHLGSSNVITDETGAQVQYCEYSPYGTITVNQAITSPVTSYLFTGKELDNSGLYFYGARYYDPEIARFVSADTIVQAPYDPQSLNRYAYCRNNPLKYTDPSGHSWGSFWKSFAKAFVSGVLGGIVTGLVTALSCGTLTPLAIALGGMVAGATNAALNGAGWQGVLIGAGLGFGLGYGLGGLALAGHGLAAGLIGGAIAVGGAVNSYQHGGWESVGDYAGGLIGSIGGSVVGYGIGTGLGNALKASSPQQQQARAQSALNTDQKPQLTYKANSELQKGYIRRYVGREEYFAIFDSEKIISKNGSTYFTPNDLGIDPNTYMAALKLDGPARFGFADIPYKNFDYCLKQTTVQGVPGGRVQEIVVQQGYAVSVRGGRLVRFDTMEQKTFTYGDQ